MGIKGWWMSQWARVGPGSGIGWIVGSIYIYADSKNKIKSENKNIWICMDKIGI